MTSLKNQWAPVALFIYNRPDHVRRTIASLRGCDGFAASPVYVFADGPKTEEDDRVVHAARAVARDLLGDRATFIEQASNRGLANSIIAGVTQLCDQFGRVIVVEDDLLLSPRFLRFVNEGLERYRDEPRVMQISGHIYDVPTLRDYAEALFLPLTTSWGWGTWQRSWQLFDERAGGWEAFLRNRQACRRFDLDGRFSYSRMLEAQMRGKRDSWAIRWYYSVFNRGGLVLFPPRSLVQNAGLDGSGTHIRRARRSAAGSLSNGELPTFPSRPEVSPAAESVYEAIGMSDESGVLRKVKAIPYIAARLRFRTR
ncbi:MAG: hypothetical protein QOJ59_1924 [Thermomicrobiales bacterium]|jgi:hypothetical protein|nr:hypothetical protein [Thermomicrobiales bacterium]